MKKFLLLSFTACLLIGCNEEKQVFKTDYFKIEINRQGYITGMWDNTKENRNFSPADNPSPLLSLYNSKEKKYQCCVFWHSQGKNEFLCGICPDIGRYRDETKESIKATQQYGQMKQSACQQRQQRYLVIGKRGDLCKGTDSQQTNACGGSKGGIGRKGCALIAT